MSNSNVLFSIYDPLNIEYFVDNIDFGEIRYYQILIEDIWGQETLSDVFEGNSNYYFNALQF